MAGMEAEMAFLNAMQAMNEAAGDYSTNGVARTDQAESLSTTDNDHLHTVKDPSESAVAGVSGEASHVPPSSAESPAQNVQSPTASRQSPPVAAVGTRDPTPSGAEMPAQLKSSSTDSPVAADGLTRPRTMAGFVVEDEDDGVSRSGLVLSGEAAILPAASGSGPSNGVTPTSARSLSRSSNARPSSPYVPPGVPTSGEDPQRHLSPMPDLGVASTSAATTANTITARAPTAPPSRDASVPAPSTAPTATEADRASGAVTKARLPHDRVGILEDRIRDDPLGDLDAWLGLINEHRRRSKYPEARAVYERFFKLFPAAAEQWVSYAGMELANNDFHRVEQVFERVLLQLPNLQLWSLYLDYVRRRHNLTTDTSGTARSVLSQTYEFVLQNVGIDKDSGRIWQDYVQFLRSGPGAVGGSNWQDQQKMDQLRKAYQRAICIPTSAVNVLWKEYDAFEMGINKMTGRKFLQEKSPAYMTARSSATELENITRGLQRTSMPTLPPALGFDGDDQYLRQVELWKAWIRWEKTDPLVLKDEDPAAYKARVVYVYKQASMALRFWPGIWFEAAEFSHGNDLWKEANDFLTQGIDANPESCLLAFKRADRLESAPATDESEEGVRRRGAMVREPYDKVLDALYDLIGKAKAREAQDVARIEESFANRPVTGPRREAPENEDDEREHDAEAVDAAKTAQIKAIQEGSAVQIRVLSKAISYAWIGLMRAMRRVQGKGKVGDRVGGSRQIFTDARKKGRLTSDVYVASALIEYHCYKDPAATKIFERGMKLFPDDEGFALEYLKHLISVNDITNARAVFETTVNRLGQKAETLARSKVIYAYFHEYECHYGELAQIGKLEKRMAKLFPDDPKLSHFSRRFAGSGFDPTALRPIISPATQTRPKAGTAPAPIEATNNMTSSQRSPPRPTADRAPSPKRYLPSDESEYENNRPRKIARGESPLKGAAGRRLDQQKRTQQQQHHPHHQGRQGHAGPSMGGGMQHPLPPVPLPNKVAFLLSIIPRAETFPPVPRFKPQEVVRLLRDLNLPSGNQGPSRSRGPPPQQTMALPQGLPHGLYPYGR